MMKTPQSKKTLTLISFYSSWTIFEGKHFDDFFYLNQELKVVLSQLTLWTYPLNANHQTQSLFSYLYATIKSNAVNW